MSVCMWVPGQYDHMREPVQRHTNKYNNLVKFQLLETMKQTLHIIIIKQYNNKPKFFAFLFIETLNIILFIETVNIGMILKWRIGSDNDHKGINVYNNNQDLKQVQV